MASSENLEANYRKMFKRILEYLTAEGMSSDEDVPQAPQKGCRVVRKDWRAPVVVNLLKWLDYNGGANACTALGTKLGPIKHIRYRKFAAESPVSRRGVVCGMPEVLYNPAYVVGLDSGGKARLGMSNVALELPNFVFTWPTNSKFTRDPYDEDEYWRPSSSA